MIGGCLHCVPSRGGWRIQFSSQTKLAASSHLDERYGDACEESCDEQEQFSAVDVAERPNEGRGEKAEEAFDPHDDPVEEEGVVAKLGVENLDHRGRDHSPGEELQIQQFRRRRR